MPGGKSEFTRSHRRQQLLEQQATDPTIKDATGSTTSTSNSNTNSNSGGSTTTDNGDGRTSASTISNLNDTIHVIGAYKIGSRQRNSHPTYINKTEIKNLVRGIVVTRANSEFQKIREELTRMLSNELKQVSAEFDKKLEQVSAEFDKKLEDHRVDVRLEVQNMFDVGGDEGNHQTNNKEENHEKVLLKKGAVEERFAKKTWRKSQKVRERYSLLRVEIL